MGYGVKTAMREFEGTTDRFNRLSADQSPQHFLNPFQRQDIQNRMSTLSDLRRNQTETAIAQRTRDTVSPQHQQLMAKLSTGASGEVGSNMAKVDIDDLQMGEQKKQERLRNLQQLASMQGQNVQMKQAYKTQAEAEKAKKKAEKGSGTNWGAIAGTVGGAALGSFFGPAGTMMGAQLGGQVGGAIDGGGQQPSAGMDMGGGSGMMGMLGGMPKTAGTSPDAGMLSGVNWGQMAGQMGNNSMKSPTLFGPGTTYSPAPGMQTSTGVSPEAAQMMYGQMFGRANSAYMGY